MLGAVWGHLPQRGCLECSVINFAFGDGTVVATATIGNDASRLFLAGVQIVPVPIDGGTQLPFTHMSVIEAASAGVFQVEKVD